MVEGGPSVDVCLRLLEGTPISFLGAPVIIRVMSIQDTATGKIIIMCNCMHNKLSMLYCHIIIPPMHVRFSAHFHVISFT